MYDCQIWQDDNVHLWLLDDIYKRVEFSVSLGTKHGSKLTSSKLSHIEEDSYTLMIYQFQ